MNFFLFLLSINLLIHNNFDQINRSNIHAFYTVIISFLYLNEINYFKENYLSLTYYSLFYCIFDIIYLIKEKISGYLSLIFHHCLIIFAILYGNAYFSSTNTLIKLMAFNYLTELSTPFLNKSFEMVENKQDNTIKFKIVNSLFVLIFGTTRILVIPYYIYYASNYTKLVIFCQTFLSTMNVIWFYKILKFYKKKIFIE